MKPVVLMILLLSLIASDARCQDAPDEEFVEDRPEQVSCSTSSRGLGIEKVKAGDEHCGLVSRERKDRALDLACSLSRENRAELRSLARQRSIAKCSECDENENCMCTAGFRPWQNVYTHVLSNRCWAECGWAYLVDCESASTPEAEGS